MPLPGVDHIVGQSPWTQELRKRILQAAQANTSVLIVGPSGSGKDLVARAIHNHSDRRVGPFVPVNCAAVPEGLFASHLFGHVKGAFTGAHQATMGCFRAAEGGTLFLDSIGELSVELQAILLRALQDRSVVPVGSDRPVPVDVRIVVATHRNLEADVRVGRFRLDLYYRLNEVTIETIGLAERPADIEPLAKHYIAKAAIDHGLPLKRLAPSALERLIAFSWPGNVRQLQNMVERAVLFTEGDVIGPTAFPEAAIAGVRDVYDGESYGENADLGTSNQVRTDEKIAYKTAKTIVDIRTSAEVLSGAESQFEPCRDSRKELQDHPWPTLDEVEREHIRKTLQQTLFNQSAAAKLLGINRKLLANKIRRYRLDVPTRRNRPE